MHALKRTAGVAVVAALIVLAMPVGLATARTAAAPTLSASATGSGPPIASFTARSVTIHNMCGFIGLFNAGASVGGASPIATYTWSFGDGSRVVTTSPAIVHHYNAGHYVIALTVTDADGASARVGGGIYGTSGSLYCL